MDKEMQKALEADGEKLRQLTGEDHGPWCVVCLGTGVYESEDVKTGQHIEFECYACDGFGRLKQ